MITFLRRFSTKQLIAAAVLLVIAYAAHWYWLLNYASQATKAFFFWPFY